MSLQKAKVATTPQVCEHMILPPTTRGKFAKRTFKSALSGKQVIDTAEQCFICHVIHPFWRAHVKSSNDAVTHKASWTTKISQESKPFKADIALKEDELGEAYHVLICRLLLQWNGSDQLRKFPITIHSVKAEEESEIAALFRWYQVDFTFRKHETEKQVQAAAARSDSKEVATDEIASFFARSSATTTDGTSTWPNQAAVFSCVRAMLDPIFGTPSVGGLKLASKYFRPSYAAKYWLNRYLRLTGQNKLPQKKSVRNVAVIHYRHEAKSPIGLDMGTELGLVAKSTKRANFRATLAGGMRFSHIILYGDFVSQRSPSLRKEMEKGFAQAEKEDKMKEDEVIEMLFISRPWLPRNKQMQPEDEEDDDVRELWAAFRRIKVDETNNDGLANDTGNCKSEADAIGSDPLPLQVKILAIWTMLCKRYSPNICVIGQRSGFIEGAAFTGIPVFYLNYKRPEGYAEPYSTLWRLVGGGENGSQNLSRLQKIANVINTLIPIYVLQDSSGKKIRVREYEPELMAALFTYTCCNSTERSALDLLPACHLPAWTVKADMMNDHCRHPISECGDIQDLDGALNYLELVTQESDDQQRQPTDRESFGPASEWPLRLSAMAIRDYRRNSADHGARRKLRQIFAEEWQRKQCQTGEEWLRRRCYFAEEVLAHEAGRPELDVLLQLWTGLRQTIDKEVESIHGDRHREATKLMFQKRTAPIPFPYHLLYDPQNSTISCIQDMSLVLCYNIYGLVESNDDSGRLEFGLESEDVPGNVHYACLYWTTHFSIEKITDPWIVEQFLRKHFLNWLELMILMGRLSDVRPMLANLKDAMHNSPFLSHDPMFGSDGLTLLEVVKRAKSFVDKNFERLFDNPLKVYKVEKPDERSLFGHDSPQSPESEVFGTDDPH